MKSWFDNIPAALRHYLIGLAALVAAAVLTYVGAHYTEWTTLPAIVQALLGMLVPLIPVAVMALTTLSRQYGVGSGDLPATGEGDDTVPAVDQTDHTDVTVPVAADPVADPVPDVVAEAEPSDPSAL